MKTTEEPKELSVEEILSQDFMPSAKLVKRRKRLDKAISLLYKERKELLISTESDANVERIRRDIRIETAQQELNEVEQILAYRIVNNL